MTTRQRRYIELLLRFVFTVGVIWNNFSVTSAEDVRCAAVGMCPEIGDEDNEVACVSYRSPKKVTDDDYEILATYCPELIAQHGSTLCCGEEQVMELSEKMGLAQTFIGKCPGCLKNLRVAVCNLICAPNHLRFFNLTEGKQVPPELAKGSSGDDDDDAGSSTEPPVVKHYVKKADLFLHSEYGTAAYESCKSVVVAAVGGNIMDLLCGKWKSAGCNARRFFDNLGKEATGVLAVETKIHLLEEEELSDLHIAGMEAFNHNTTACHEEVGEEGACACLDCAEACPVVDPPVSSTQLTFYQKDDMLYMMTGIGITGAIAIIVAGFMGHLSRKKSASSDLTMNGGTEMQMKGDQNGSAEKNGNGTHQQSGGAEPEHDDAVSKTLRSIAIFAARNPYQVLAPGIFIVIILSYGLTYVKMQTDPVELWTPPGSRARLEREYFSQTFGSLFRIEQVILTAKEGKIPPVEYDSPEEGRLKFGPVFNQKFMRAVWELQRQIQNLKSPSGYKLSDICLKPLAPENNNCLIMGYLDWWQNDLNKIQQNWNVSAGKPIDEDNYLDHFLYCSSSMFTSSCLGRYGGPIDPSITLGQYKKTEDGKPDYKTSKTVLITYFGKGYINKSMNGAAKEWEKHFVQFMKNLAQDKNSEIAQNMDIAFTTERSIEDEIEASSRGEFKTIVISYLVMFLYISVNLRDSYNLDRFFVESRVLLGITGILIVLASVTASVGLFGYYGLPATMIIMEVIPFLVLAVGVDNIFIIVQHYQRSERLVGESRPDHIGRIVAEVAPSMVLNSLTDSVCFFLGSLSGMPAVRALSIYAGVALIFNFMLQFTVFIAIFSLDLARSEEGRMDIFCCIQKEKSYQKTKGGKGILYTFFKKVWAPLLLTYPMRVFVILVFFIWACVSMAALPRIKPGMDPDAVLPEDSHVTIHLRSLFKYADIGLPLFFVVKDTGFDYKSSRGQDLIRGGGSPYSLVSQIATAAKFPNVTHIAKPPMAWIDDYLEWVSNDNCCKVNRTTNGFCPSSKKENQKLCGSCKVHLSDGHLTAQDFDKYLPWFLQDNPTMECLKGGHALYSSAVSYKRMDESNPKDTRLHIGATFYMTFSTVLKTSEEFTSAMTEAHVIADNITATLNRETNSTQHQVFPYSLIFVFYEQFSTIWRDTLVSFSISFLTVLVMTFFVLGRDFYSSVIILSTIFMIVVDIGGMMYFWNIALNGVTLVNLVVAVGISVEFCTHIVHAFLVSREPDRVSRSRDSLVNMGSSVLSGITLTKFGGICVLAFARSPAFRMFYFKMYLLIVCFGAAHGLIFLPVLLSFIGPFRKSDN